jgi:hypothetical protein
MKARHAFGGNLICRWRAEKRAWDAILVTAPIQPLPSGQEHVFLCDLRVSAF